MTHSLRYTKFFKGISIIFLIAAQMSSCIEKQQETQTNEKFNPPEKGVEIMILRKEVFTSELISNGKISAALKAELRFDTDGSFDSIAVKNGQLVKKGDVLAVLRNDQVGYRLRMAELALEKARIDRLDALLGMGYKDITDSSIQEEHQVIANIRSGYSQAKLEFEEASNVAEHLVLKAPFNGKVEGITSCVYERAGPTEIFCSLINEEIFLVRFPVLESEVSEITEGQEIRVTPLYSQKAASGKILQINPRVDSNGLIWVQGEIPNSAGLLEGMNVRIRVKKAISGHLVVPKNAVVLRQNREVLFRFNRGKALWTYIRILHENEYQYAIEAAKGAELHPGDSVIVSNNLNLAHESEVVIN